MVFGLLYFVLFLYIRLYFLHLLDYVKKIEQVLSGIVLDEPIQNNKLRWSVDDTTNSLGKKIKRATELKIPVVLVVGPKDVENKEVSVRLKDKEERVALKELNEYLQKLQ